jgi:hypothetical protein
VKRAATYCAVGVAILAIVVALPYILPPDEVEYRGEKIRLAKWYFGNEHYKLDPQIDPAEMPRVERLMMAPAPTAFASRRELIHYGTSLWFPGYGVRFFGRDGASASRLEGVCTVIPPGDKWRCLVYRGVREQYARVDDFVAKAALNVGGVREEGHALVYHAAGDRPRTEGPEVLRRVMSEPE